MTDDGYTEEISEYTVYKSKIEFDRLRKAIQNRETMSRVINMILLIVFGIVEIILVTFAFIYARDRPMLGVIPLMVASN